MNIMNQKGFTLIELMIAILIGLIITAAAVQVYVMGVRNASIQKAASGVLDANVFGLQQIERNLRMAGLGLGETSRLNKECSGVIVSQGAKRLNCDNSPTDKSTDIYVTKLRNLSADLRTKADGGPSNTSNANTAQLTIQYRAPVDMRDCEGQLALGPRIVQQGYLDGQEPQVDDKGEKQYGDPIRVDGQVIIERYFVKRNNEGLLELRCDAGRYVPEHIIQGAADKPAGAEILGANSSIQNMGGEGSLVIAGIDDFQVQLGIKSKAQASNSQNNPLAQPAKMESRMQYVDVATYTRGGIEGDVVAIKVGILAKGAVATPIADASADAKYNLFGQEISLKADQPANAIRRVYETTTMLRNSREGKK